MKKLLPAALAAVTLGLTAAVAVPTLAKPAPGAARMGGQHGQGMKKLADYLGLTDAQKAQLKPILQGARQQAKAIKENTSLTPTAKQAKMKDLRKSTNQQMMGVLTPAQREKLKDLRQMQHAGA